MNILGGLNGNKKKIEENSKDTNFIKLVNGNELIDLLKENDLYNQIFKIDDSLKIAEIYNAVVPKKNRNF